MMNPVIRTVFGLFVGLPDDGTCDWNGFYAKKSLECISDDSHFNDMPFREALEAKKIYIRDLFWCSNQRVLVDSFALAQALGFNVLAFVSVESIVVMECPVDEGR